MKISLRLRFLLWLVKFTQKKPMHEMTPKEVRASSDTRSAKFAWILDEAPIPMTNVEDRLIYMRDSEQIAVRIYQPSSQPNLPVIVYFHGGGFVLNGLDSHDKVCRRVAKNNEAIVIAVDYRLAPEYKFPTAAHDAYDATLWAAKNASQFNGDLSRLSLMGDSAGANLAAVAAIMIRDNGGPRIERQVLVYPCTDARMETESINTFAEGYLLTKRLIEWFVSHYKRSPIDKLDPRMSPLLTKDLSNLPPAFVLTAEFDPLKDEGRMYAERLKESGNSCLYKDYKGAIHGFFSIPRILTQSLEAHQDIRAFLKNPVFDSSLVV